MLLVDESTKICQVDLIKRVDSGTDTIVDYFENYNDICAELDDMIYRYTIEKNAYIKQVGMCSNKTILLLDNGKIMLSGEPLDKFDMYNNKITNVFKIVDNINSVHKIATSENNIFLLLDDGTIMVYGDNTKHQLGIPQVIEYAYKFIQLPDFDDIIDIISTKDRTFIRRSDKSIWYCGKSLYKSDEYMDTFVKIKFVEDTKKIILGKDSIVIQTYSNRMYYMNLKPNHLDWDKELFKWYMNPMNKYNEIDFILIPQYENGTIKKIIFDKDDNIIVLYESGTIYNYGNTFTEYAPKTPIKILNKYNIPTKVLDMLRDENDNLILLLSDGYYFNYDEYKYFNEYRNYKILDIFKCNNNIIKLFNNGELSVKGHNTLGQLGVGIRKNINKFMFLDVYKEEIKNKMIKHILED